MAAELDVEGDLGPRQLPSIAALCGWELPSAYALTGQSFAPALQNQLFAGRERVFCSESSRQASLAVRTPKWKLIQPIVEDAHGNPLPHLHGNAWENILGRDEGFCPIRRGAGDADHQRNLCHGIIQSMMVKVNLTLAECLAMIGGRDHQRRGSGVCE